MGPGHVLFRGLPRKSETNDHLSHYSCYGYNIVLSPMMNVYASLSTAGICVLRAVVHISAESL